MKKKIPDKIAVNIEVSCDAIGFNRRRIIEMVRKTAGRFGVKKAQINFAVLDGRRIAKLNRKFLSRQSVTDVISFDLSESLDLKIFDIAVNAEMAQRQAATAGLSGQSELALYFLHGLLHNLGFDDSTAKKAAKMHKAEDNILEKFGYGVVYNRERRN